MSSRYEELLERLLNDDGIDDIVPESRAEAYLMALIKKNGSVDVEGIIIDPNAFGDAEPQDVMAGKIFSSKGGVGMVGTAVDKGAMVDGLLDGTIVDLSSNVTKIKDGTFNGSKTLNTVDLPLVTDLGDYAFQNCSNMTTINAPLVETIGNSTFKYCTSLTAANFPLFRDGSLYTFDGCSSLSIVVFPLLESINSGMFRNCIRLHTADFTNLTFIGDKGLFNCIGLKRLIIRNIDAVPTLQNSNALVDTEIESDTGYIYVPRALIEDYKVASNWSDYAAQFRALEDYTVDGTTTGALDDSKI